MTNTVRPTAVARAAELIDPRRCAQVEIDRSGYVDTLGNSAPPTHNIAQRAMRTTFYSTIYQLVRPLGFRVLAGAITSSGDAERARISSLLQLRPGDTVLDIGCGPGNFTGWFGAQAFPRGLAVGVDASQQMLHRAIADNSADNVAYLRGDAEHLPFRDESADAVACLAALYLINKPFHTIAEIARVLKPGGRVAILTSLGRNSALRSPTVHRLSGVHMFGPDEITDGLRDVGFTAVRQDTGGLAQTVTAVKP